MKKHRQPEGWGEPTLEEVKPLQKGIQVESRGKVRLDEKNTPSEWRDSGEGSTCCQESPEEPQLSQPKEVRKWWEGARPHENGGHLKD